MTHSFTPDHPAATGDHATAMPRPRTPPHGVGQRGAAGKRGVIAAGALCAMLLGAGAQAALQDRDLDGDTVVDAFYDTDLDITWLRNANVNGAMNWWNAVAWADGFSFGGYSDWRLPTSDTSCSGYNCTGSEIGHLWYLELGNPAGGPMTHTGDFLNLSTSTYYWSATQWAPDPASTAWYFQTNNGSQAFLSKPNALLAMVVRDGDVAVVPEPGTFGLALGGLLALAAVRRRRSA